jgi:glucosyl-dolichyl phosphate glucuronosyltransferase
VGTGIDIVFATHNGERTLPLMLAALRTLAPPRRPWRVVAVDNASTDRSAALLRDAAADLPMLILACAEPGKMPALKMAAKHVSGDLVLFTDDDVTPAPAWLQAYEAGADQAGEDVGVFGGPITPTPMEELSPWFESSRRYHAELFALTDEPDGWVDAEAHIYGPNFLIRRTHIDVLDTIAAGVGPTFSAQRRRTFAMGEDSLIVSRVAGRGAGAIYVRAARVGHLVRRFQTDLGFMLDRAERHGRGAAIRDLAGKPGAITRRLRIVMQNAPGAGAPSGAGAAPSAETFERLWLARWRLGAIKAALFDSP